MTGPEPSVAFLRKWRKDHAALVDKAKAANLLVGRKGFGKVPPGSAYVAQLDTEDAAATAYWGEPPAEFAED
jgi:hypothetical protein